MFSHLLGNLVLRTLDQYFSKNLSAKYFRYVDDIIFVGESAAVHSAHSEAKARLLELGFKLHDQDSDKHLEVAAEEWLRARNDYHERGRGISWKSLIGDMKRFLLLNPKGREELQSAFRQEGFRLPVHDYSSAAREVGFLDRIRSLASHSWFRRKSQTVSIKTLLSQARWLRKRYEEQFRRDLDKVTNVSPFGRKRLTPKLRYRASRLIYLANDDVLASLSHCAAEVPELFFHSKVMAGIASRNIDQLLGLGTNAGQAAAQPLRASGERVAMTRSDLSEPEEQSLAVFLLNGVPVTRGHRGSSGMSELMRFTTVGADTALTKSSNPFLREIACLHGLAEKPRHPDILESVFDLDEDLAMDARSTPTVRFSLRETLSSSRTGSSNGIFGCYLQFGFCLSQLPLSPKM
jgi:hypothetical protein